MMTEASGKHLSKYFCLFFYHTYKVLDSRNKANSQASHLEKKTVHSYPTGRWLFV